MCFHRCHSKKNYLLLLLLAQTNGGHTANGDDTIRGLGWQWWWQWMRHRWRWWPWWPMVTMMTMMTMTMRTMRQLAMLWYNWPKPWGSSEPLYQCNVQSNVSMGCGATVQSNVQCGAQVSTLHIAHCAQCVQCGSQLRRDSPGCFCHPATDLTAPSALIWVTSLVFGGDDDPL